MPHTFIAGVDLGATNVRVAIAESDGEIAARRSMPYDGTAPEETLARIGRVIDELARGVWPGARVAAIGVAVPGAVDPGRGVVNSPANLPGWGQVPLAELLGGEGVRVAMDNDANAAAAGEGWLGAARGLRDFAFIALGTGIGCGLVLDGRLYNGAHFLAGEVAYFPMSRDQLRECGWDNCLEAVVGGRAIAAKARDLLGADATPGQLFDSARAGDEAASAWLSATQEHLAMAVVDIVSLLDPQAVIFGGGVAMAQGEALLAPVRELALRCTVTKPKIVLSQLGDQAQILGAIKLARDKLGSI